MASVSRIDADTGEIVGVTDLDIGGETASVSDIPGFGITDGDAWAFVRFAGSPFRGVMIRLDPVTGQVRSARTVHVDGNTWEPTPERVWFHRAETGSIIAAHVDDFDAAESTPLSDLVPPTSAPTTTATVDPPSSDGPTADELAVAEAFARFTDPTIPSRDLDLGPLATARDELLELLDAQVSGDARLIEVIVDGDIGIARFDVVVEGDTVIQPGLEFVFEREPGTSPWSITRPSLCLVAGGVGIDCP